VLPRHDLHRVVLGDIHCRPILGHLVLSPKHLHQAAKVLGTSQALKLDMCDLPLFVIYFSFQLPYPFLQGHGGLDLQQTHVRLQSCNFCLASGCAELS
jgi:hypothetical protein